MIRKLHNFVYLVLAFAITYSFTGCSGEQETISNKQIDPKEESYTFYKDGSQWKAVFKDGDLTDLYKDGTKLPDDDLEEYSGMVNNKLSRLKIGHFVMPKIESFSFDSDAFKEQMKKLKEEMKNKKWDIHIDKEQLEKELYELNQLKDHDFHFDFDAEALEESMRELKEHLKNIKPYEFKLDFDEEEFQKNMEELQKNLKENQLKLKDMEFNFDDFNDDMAKLNEDLKNLDFDMEGLDEELDKLDTFLKEFKKELVKDKLIENEDEDYTLEFSVKQIVVNGEKVPQNLVSKYKELYKNHFGKDIDHNGKIVIR